MSEELIQATETVDTVPPPTTTTEMAEPVAAEPTSIADHAKQFNPDREPEPAAEPVAESVKGPHHSAEQRRDRESGQFKDGKRRHRASTAIAGAEDVPRIQKLTGERNEAREKITALEQELATLRRPTQTPPPNGNGNGHPPAAAPAQASWSPVERVSDPSDPEPQETDAAFGGDPMKYLEARFRWAARDEQRQFWAQQQRTQAQHELHRSFAERVAPVAQKYPDFAAKIGALDAAKVIPQPSAIDEFIMTDDTGPEVLYHLASHPEELGAILRVAPFEQVKRLALLSQRFASPQTVQAGVTGSVASPVVPKVLPKPPNPVRTQASGGSASPAMTEARSIRDHAKEFGGALNRRR